MLTADQNQTFGVGIRNETRPIGNHLLGVKGCAAPHLNFASCFHINPCRPMDKGKADSKMDINKIFLSNFDENC
jgi:hypothetical protein